ARTADDFLGQRVQLIGRHLVHVFVRGARHRMQNNFAMPVLPASAGLLYVLSFGFRLLANRFAVRHLGTSDVGLHVVFAQHAVDDDFQMQLAHAGNQGLPGTWFGGHGERGIFRRKPLHGHAQLVLVSLGLGLDGHGNDRRREVDGFENDLLLLVAERVAGVYALEAHAGADIAGVDFFDFLPLVGVHLQQAADAFARALWRIVDVTAGFQDAGIDADVGDMPD